MGEYHEEARQSLRDSKVIKEEQKMMMTMARKNKKGGRKGSRRAWYS
jgi:hypothetical protein